MTQVKPALYLFPVPMSADVAPAEVLPAPNLELLTRVKYFAVENIRSARRFLRAVSRDIDIDSLSLVELSEHTPESEIASMIQPLVEGNAMGVISEAGCPAVADPGALLVAEAQRRGLPVVPLVGPSSILMSLMASGFNGQQFTFHGYLPIDAHARVKAIREMERAAHRGVTQIFIETPYRNNRLLADLAATLAPATRICVAADVTGPAESIVTLTASGWRSRKYDYAKIPTIFLISSL
ncbi:MAG: SAM-dependent methyltransferase [Muribaculaceae bacterium]|nr:SAM-dependent methyltransferase [Muribaculaceae bacterium]